MKKLALAFKLYTSHQWCPVVAARIKWATADI